MLRAIYGTIRGLFFSSESDAPLNLFVVADKCYTGSGKITFVCQIYGVIDGNIYFNIGAVYKGNVPLVIGMTVTYLAYRRSSTQEPTVITILNASVNVKTLPELSMINKSLNVVKSNDDNGIFTYVQHYALDGEIIYCSKMVIKLKTKEAVVTVPTEKFPLGFEPTEGDRFYIVCRIHEFDDRVNVPNVVKLIPVGVQLVETMITKLEKDWGLLDNTYFFKLDQIPNDCTPRIGDKAVARVIESHQQSYEWRCVEITSVIILTKRMDKGQTGIIFD